MEGTLSASQRLPVELVREICILAAEQDRNCAYSLAFVSRAICQCTAEARWRVIAITSIAQLLAFYREIHAISDEVYNSSVKCLSRVDRKYSSLTIKGRHRKVTDDPEDIRNHESLLREEVDEDETKQGRKRRTGLERMFERAARIKRRKDAVSFPITCEPHKCIRHLFIDLPDIVGQTNKIEFASSGWERFLYDVDMAKKIFIDENKSNYRTQDMYWQRDNFLLRFRHTLFKFLDFNLDHLSIGSFELGLPDMRKDSIVKELTFIHSHNDRGFPSDFLSAKVLPRRIHIIGIDTYSKPSGRDPPWSFMKMMINLRMHSDYLTHLRYDTRKFSFKPAEIFATRLRPLLQELTLKPSSTSNQNDNVRNGYIHKGPPHAAPARGAGHMDQYKTSSLTPAQHFANNACATFLIEQWKVGQLDFLQFAWDPMNEEERKAANVPLHKSCRYSLGKKIAGMKVDDGDSRDTGGWPREMRGAWTERSDRDLAPSFAVELRDAIHQLYGWQAPGIISAAKFSAQKDLITSKEERDKFRNVAFSPDHAGEMVERIKTGLSDIDQRYLERCSSDLRDKGFDIEDDGVQYGVRAPQSLIHLGGKVPFELEDRLVLFEDRARGGKGAWP